MYAQFQHVLVPVDFSEKDKTALEIACGIAVQNHARVTLLHVILTFDFEDNEVQEFYSRVEATAREKLNVMTPMLSDAGISVESKVLFGNQVREIVQFAAGSDVDLIIMNSHSVDVEEPARSLSTVSYQVSMLCQCPVMLVK